MKNIIDEISFGLLTLLEEHDSITNVHSMDTGCATVKMIHHWEQVICYQGFEEFLSYYGWFTDTMGRKGC